VQLDSITDLLATIDALPPAEQRVARRRVESALDGPAAAARAALGLLALDLAARNPLDATAGVDADAVEVIVLPELQPQRATA
jgi:hypothetical protein